MLTRAQTSDLVGILATAAIVGVGYYIGTTTAAAAMLGLGINLSSSLIAHGSVNLKEQWLSRGNRILNHDLQQALMRALDKALTRLEAEYFQRGEARALPKNEQASIRELFRALQRQVQEEFPARLEQAMQEHQVAEYLYAPPEVARDKLWEQINGPALLRTYSEDFTSFLHKHLLNVWQFYFGEELKIENRECTRAWRAFQRLLLEGIQASVQAAQAGQDLLHQEVQKLMALRTQLEALPPDRRVPNEPFLEALETAINEVRVLLQDIASTTHEIRGDVKTIQGDVKTIQGDVKTILDVVTGQGRYPTGGTGLQSPAPLPAAPP